MGRLSVRSAELFGALTGPAGRGRVDFAIARNRYCSERIVKSLFTDNMGHNSPFYPFTALPNSLAHVISLVSNIFATCDKFATMMETKRRTMRGRKCSKATGHCWGLGPPLPV
ncbi:hypothetical protein ACJJTC_010812 [Scirpophaga incertulas]